jgi:acetyltransferase-like isoleucine patch superfamily enzyme
MDQPEIPPFKTHGNGDFLPGDFKKLGMNVIFEKGVLVFHPERISIGSNVYIGHYTMLKGYHKNEMQIGDNSWIGQNCFLHSAGGLKIGSNVGIGPGVNILTSTHDERDRNIPIITHELNYGEVALEEGCDIGIGAIILPGITIGKGSIVGAGSVVTRDVDPFTVVAGNPARFLRIRH